MKSFKYSLRKLVKGAIGIITIKVLILTIGLVVQSCDNNEQIEISNTNQKAAIDKFEKSVVSNMVNIYEFAYDENEKRLNNNNFKGYSNKVLNKADIKLKPLIDSSKELLNFYGYGDNELTQDFGNSNDRRVILLGLMFLSAKQQLNAKTAQADININSLFFSQAYAQGIRGCFLETTGIAAGAALVAALGSEVVDKTLIRKLIKKAIKKIGGRVLGGVGLAIMVADFGFCMARSKCSQNSDCPGNKKCLISDEGFGTTYECRFPIRYY